MLGSLSISITVKFLNARRLPLLFEPKIKKSPAENHQCVFFLSADVAHRSLRQSSLDLTTREYLVLNSQIWETSVVVMKKQCHNLLTAAVIPLYIIRFLKRCTDDPQMNTCRSFFAGDLLHSLKVQRYRHVFFLRGLGCFPSCSSCSWCSCFCGFAPACFC